MQSTHEVYNILSNCFPTFSSTCQPADLSISKCQSWSNKLLLVQTSTQFQPNKILIRFFGNVSKVVEKEKERRMFSEISRLNFGISQYSCTEYYRIEKYLEPTTSLSGLLMKEPKIISYFAQSLCDLHYNEDLNKALAEYSPISAFANKALEKWGGCIIKEVPNWIQQCKTEQQREILNQYKGLLNPEFESYYKKTVSFCSNLVCSHNDIHAGNLLLLDNAKVILIDFEYMNFNPRALDLGTYASEICCNYGYPVFPLFSHEEEYRLTDAEIEFLCSEYLKCYHAKYYKGDANKASPL